MRIVRLVPPAVAVLLVGCYTLQPTGGTAPAPGTRVAFEVNDMGRVALGERIGREVAQIEGRLIASENGEHQLAVHSITYLRGGHEVWRGERIRVRSEHIGNVYERRFSPARSTLLGAASVGAVGYLVTRALGVFGTEGETDPNGKNPTDTAIASRGLP